MTVYGDYLLAIPDRATCLEFSFFITPDFNWQANNLLAQFMADYFANSFPTSAADPLACHFQSEVTDSINYITNELLENAVKFHCNRAFNIKCGLAFDQDELIIYVANVVNQVLGLQFQERIDQLLKGDPGELLIQQIEANALSNNNNLQSGLGLLTIMNDYQARLGWKFEQVLTIPHSFMVTTMVRYSGMYPFLKKQLELAEVSESENALKMGAR